MTDDDRKLSYPGLSPDEERARAVAEVLRDQAARAAAYRTPTPRPHTTWARVGALVVSTLVLFYVWFAPPAWLSPAPPPPIAPEVEQATLRLAIYIQAQRIEAFRASTGRLPDVLEEVGEPLAGLRYERLDARYFRLRAFGDTRTEQYVSSDSLRAFAAGSDRTLGLIP